MALLKIAKLGNPVLRQVAKQIELNELVNPDSGLMYFNKSNEQNLSTLNFTV